jgi:hypothetical protein
VAGVLTLIKNLRARSLKRPVAKKNQKKLDFEFVDRYRVRSKEVKVSAYSVSSSVWEMGGKATMNWNCHGVQNQDNGKGKACIQEYSWEQSRGYCGERGLAQAETPKSMLLFGVMFCLSELLRDTLLSDDLVMLMGIIKMNAEGFSHDFLSQQHTAHLLPLGRIGNSNSG